MSNVVPQRRDRWTRALLALLGAALLSVLMAGSALAQSASLVMRASPTTLEVGQNLRLEITCQATGAQAPQIQPPDLSAFEIVSQSFSQPMSFQFGIGGGGAQVIQSTTQLTFLLRPRGPGRIELGPARATFMGRPVESNPLTIAVGGSAAPQPGQPGNPQGTGQGGTGQSGTGQSGAPPGAEPPTGPLDGALYDDQAFLRTVVDRREAFVGQQVTVTHYLYVRGGLRSTPSVTREATTAGFWVQDLLPPSRTIDASTQMVGSTPFRVYVIRRFAAFPLREGELEIGAMTARIPMGSVFDLFGGAQPDLERTGVPVSVTVRPLPSEGRPPGITGDAHVGAVALEARVDRAQVPTGDAVTLTLRATGTGYVQSIQVPDPRVDGIRVLAPQVRDEVSSPGDLVGGARTWEWLIVPEREGTFTIPAFRVLTFDAAASAYRVATSEPITLTAAGNPVGAVPDPDEASTETPDESPAEPSAELDPIRTESALVRGQERLVDQPWLPWLFAIFPLAWLFTLGMSAMRKRLDAGARGAAVRLGRQVRQRLAEAEAHRAAGDARALYGTLRGALGAVVEGRLGEAVGSLTHTQLRALLVQRGMSEDLGERVAAELEGLEAARFSRAGAEPSEMQRAIERVQGLFAELEKFVPNAGEGA